MMGLHPFEGREPESQKLNRPVDRRQGCYQDM